MGLAASTKLGPRWVAYEQEDGALSVACCLTQGNDGVDRAYPVEFTFHTFTLPKSLQASASPCLGLHLGHISLHAHQRYIQSPCAITLRHFCRLGIIMQKLTSFTCSNYSSSLQSIAPFSCPQSLLRRKMYSSSSPSSAAILVTSSVLKVPPSVT